ncbi:ankyrin repeat domain-containing protein 27-like [Sitophilus oryzae]|uniref:Ankyrin repeat domain-containing protein 27-like n=1 Tax=Sitophilus oryzae TaxID=7048 RepID=A0A6J2XKI7_SITOR|nr:ankyrin repeat domain-containing protein 27-like [Sitophilus oryzae]
MWSQYDEDLSKNVFFKSIKEYNSDILSKAATEKWIICVPRTGSQRNKNISITTILDHVLVPHSADTFSTLSKKNIHLKDQHLKYDNIFNVDVEVLFEETHYVGGENKYTVWCIEKPLFLSQNFSECSNNQVSLLTLQDCVDFLFNETAECQILESIQNLCTTFWKNEEKTFALDILQSQIDLIGNLFSQCLQVCFKSDGLREKCNSDELFLENLKLAVQTCMQYCLGQKLMYGINSLHHFTDSELNKIIRNSLNVSLSDLNIPCTLENEIISAKYELSRINNVFTCLDKVNCLARAFNVFNRSKNLQKLDMCLTSDDFLQIFVYLILQCNIPNWIANLSYIKYFNFTNFGNTDQNCFLKANLEGSIEFIKSSAFLENKISCMDKYTNEDNKSDQHSNTIFYYLYNKLKKAKSNEDLCNFLRIIFNKYLPETDLCHPLCSCKKCEQILMGGYNQKIKDVVNEHNQNFLIFSCIGNNIELIELLLSLEFNINFKDYCGKTALHYAAQLGFQDVLMLLINFGADVNIADNDKNTPLHLASDRGHENCVNALIYSSNLVELNLQNFSGDTPLFLAAKWGYINIVKVLLEGGASVCIKNNRKMSVLQVAPNYYITELIKWYGVVKSNKVIKEVECLSNTSNHSISNISEDIAFRNLKERGIFHGIKPKNDTELKSINVLLKSIENNDFPLACYYLGYTNILDLKKINLDTKCHPLCNCKACSAVDELDVLDEKHYKKKVRFKININTVNKDGFSALHIAAKFGRIEILRILLDSGASTNLCTYETYYTPLHLACMFERVPAVKELLKCGDCNIDAQDYKGNTPLYYGSIKNNNLKLVEILIHNGADSQKTNDSGKSILLQCEEKNYFRICSILKENAVSKSKTSNTNESDDFIKNKSLL